MVKSEALADRYGLFAAGIGALTAWIMGTDTVSKNDTLKKNWWLIPVALLGGGYLLMRKNKLYGRTLMTLGGLYLVQSYRNRPKDSTQQTKSDTAGPAYWNIPQGSRWVTLEDGRQLLVSAEQWKQMNGLPPPSNDVTGRMAHDLYGRRPRQAA